MHALIFAIAAFGTGALFGATILHSTPAPQPEPASESDERSPDYCFTHKEIEPQEGR